MDHRDLRTSERNNLRHSGFSWIVRTRTYTLRVHLVSLARGPTRLARLLLLAGLTATAWAQLPALAQAFPGSELPNEPEDPDTDAASQKPSEEDEDDIPAETVSPPEAVELLGSGHESAPETDSQKQPLTQPPSPSGESSPEAPAPDAVAPDAAAGKKPRKGELAGLPAIAGNDTFGFLFGVTGSYTTFAPGYAPFRFRTQVTAVSSILKGDSGVKLPLQNVDVRFDLPGLLGGRMRVFTLLRFQRVQNVGYWGLGEGTSGAIPDDYTGPRDQFFTYERLLVEGRAFVRYRLIPHLEWVSGLGARFVKPTAVPDSRLARDLADADPPTRSLLYGVTQQGLVDGLLGLLWDNRDHEFNPKRGSYQELSVRTGGGPSQDRTLHYGAIYAHTRWFFPLVDEYLVLALRALADVAVGNVPLTEMGSIGGYAQISGPAGIEANRGLPYGRQLGKVKLLSTVELRSTFLHFKAGRHQFALGAAVFVDASRVWSQLGGTPGLDNGPLVRVSTGGGPRLLWGRALMLRVDVGVGPKSGINDVNNVSGTLALGHAF